MATTKKIRPELIKLASNIETMIDLWGLSQDKFGEIMGENRSTVSNWTRAHTSPDVNNLLQLNQMSGIPIEDLINTVVPLEKLPAAPLTVTGIQQVDKNNQVLGLFNDLGLRHQLQLLLDRIDRIEQILAKNRQDNP